MPKVFVSGCFDLLHSGHIKFLKEASQYGELYVGIGSNETIKKLKNHESYFDENERLYMIKSIKYVKEAFICSGTGYLDFEEDIKRLKPDKFIVNLDGDMLEKRQLCNSLNIEYIVLNRTPIFRLPQRSSSSIKQVPTRIDLAGGWFDHPFLSSINSGCVITLSILPTFEIPKKCGLATSTREVLKPYWPFHNTSENAAKIAFSLENNPDHEGPISGAQDAIGICMPGLTKHYYNGKYWPDNIITCNDSDILNWLEEHICLIPMNPRDESYDPLKNINLHPQNVSLYTGFVENVWDAILKKDLGKFAYWTTNSYRVQCQIFPEMLNLDYYQLPVLGFKALGAGQGWVEAIYKEQCPGIPIKIRR